MESRKWTGTVNILSNRFVDELPPETWEADPEIAEDMGEIPDIGRLPILVVFGLGLILNRRAYVLSDPPQSA